MATVNHSISMLGLDRAFPGKSHLFLSKPTKTCRPLMLYYLFIDGGKSQEILPVITYSPIVARWLFNECKREFSNLQIGKKMVFIDQSSSEGFELTKQCTKEAIIEMSHTLPDHL